MSTISSSVGRGGVNRPEDVRTIQRLLNQYIQPPQSPLEVDGAIGAKTITAIERFQKDVVKLAQPDGRVDPGGRTFAALAAAAPAPAPAVITPPAATGLPPIGDGSPLTEADFQRAATTLRCEVACIKAVNEVESRGSGFLPSKRPKILFEAHQFSRLTQHKYDSTHPDISSRKWNQSLYKGGEKEYDRLGKAMALNHEAALSAASWGRFQIMGFNHKIAGFDTVDAFVEAMFEAEGKHLDAFVNFIRNTKLDAPLREKRWADFARGYNGAEYAKNNYDGKLKVAYAKYSK